MIATVTTNPAVDVTIDVTTLDPGASHVIEPSRRRAGGKGLNVARVLAQTGHEVTALGLAGADDVAWFAEDLPGVDVALTACQSPTRHTYALVETDRGRTSQLNERGFARSAAEWDDLIARVADVAHRASCVTVSGSLPPDSPGDAVARIIEAADHAHTPVIADLTGAALRQAAACGAQLLKPNRDELAATVRSQDPVSGARALLDAGAQLVVVSLGEDGMLAVPAGGDALHAGLGRVLHGNATGAGDAAVAAMAASLGEGEDPREDLPALLVRAVGWSAAAVLAPLAGTLDSTYRDLCADVRVSAA